MHNSKIFIFFFISFLAFSQNSYQAIYSLEYKTDSLKENFKKEIFFLNFDKNESVFKSRKIYDIDSLNSVGKATLSSALKGYTLFREVINMEGSKINVLYKNNGNFQFTQEPASWSIKNKFEIVNGIKCRVATSNFLGRKWEACYAEEYPFSYGPYMFNNLPGLIISVKDDKKSYIFKLESIKKHQIINYDSVKDVKMIPKNDFYTIVIDALFGLSILDKTNFNDPALEAKMRKGMEEQKKKSNNFPIDLEMNYLLK
jgi:GLPGLI family protein